MYPYVDSLCARGDISGSAQELDATQNNEGGAADLARPGNPRLLRKDVRSTELGASLTSAVQGDVGVIAGCSGVDPFCASGLA